MKDLYERKITVNRVELIRKLEIDDEFLAYFRQEDIFTRNLEETILVLKITGQRNGKFLDILSRKGNNAWTVFISALVKTKQYELADLLDESLSKEKQLEENSFDTVTLKKHEHFLEIEDVDLDKIISEDFDKIHITPTFYGNCIFKRNPNIIKEIEKGDTYDLRGPKKGMVVIVNCFIFDGKNLSKREGSNIDYENILSMFTYLDFEVVVWENLGETLFKSKLNKLVKSDIGDARSLIFFILSHGFKGGFYLCDAIESKSHENSRGHFLIDDLINMFSPQNCPLLAHKPKLFFIQACQGKEKAKGNMEQSDGENTNEMEIDLNSKFKNFSITDANKIKSNSAHPNSDIFIAYATVENYVSWRMKDKGTWFIRALLIAMKAYANSKSLSGIMDTVNAIVMKRKTMEHGYIQQPQYVSTCLPFYFFPNK